MDFKIISLHFIVIIYLKVSPLTLENSPFVVIKDGKIEGSNAQTLKGRNFISFLGIPYAKAPIENLRFENPVQVEPWSGTLSAKTMPEPCLQIDMHQMLIKKNFTHSGKEDCLYLNVFTPKVDPDKNMAVMVFIHGGGFFNGGAFLYEPHALLDEDVILVVIQYRLGIMGFLSTGDEILPGNIGLKDQTFALKWVQENIAQFGGDKNRVTLFGQSAGASSVQFQMLSPLSKGLFHRAILHSGSTFTPWSSLTHQRKLAEQISEITKCPLKGKDLKQCLKKADAMTLLDRATESFEWGVSPLLASPTVDGEFLEEEPSILMKNKKYHKVNVISGITREEGAFFSALSLKNTILMDELRDKFEKNSPLSLFYDNEDNAALLAKEIYDHYMGGQQVGASMSEEFTQMLGDGLFIIPHDLTSMFLAEDEDVNLYRFELMHRGAISFLDFFEFDYGSQWVTHGDDLIYLLHPNMMQNRPPGIQNADDVKLREILIKLWVQFARTGNPTPSDKLGFVWPASTTSQFVHLAMQPQPEVQEYSRGKILEFWLSLPTRLNKIFAEQNIAFTKIEKESFRLKTEL